MGETAVLSGTDSNSANALARQSATLSQPGTLASISINVATAVGQMRLGVYDSAYHLLAQTAVFTPVSGWNTQLLNNVQVGAGTYWLAWFASDNAMSNPIQVGVGEGQWTSMTFGDMPATLPASSGTATEHWSIYATATLSVP